MPVPKNRFGSWPKGWLPGDLVEVKNMGHSLARVLNVDKRDDVIEGNVAIHLIKTPDLNPEAWLSVPADMLEKHALN